MQPDLDRPSARRFLPVRCIPFLLVALQAGLACSDEVTGPEQTPDDDPQPGAYDHDRAPGASAHDLLSADDYDRLVVEVQYVEGLEPSAAGLDHLRDFVDAHLNKPGGVTIEVAAAPISIATQATYTSSEIRSLEEEHRTEYTDGTTLAVYALFLDGEYDGSPNVLGIAYNNTSLAIFEETIRAHSGGPLQPAVATVEGTVLQHELGHLMGLVNNGSEMQTEHQDEPNGHHCDDENCLMYWAVRTTDFIENLLGGMPQLDADCVADLVANGGS